MRYRELTRKLRALGCEFDRQSRGSHEIWRNPANGARTTIPNWAAAISEPGRSERSCETFVWTRAPSTGPDAPGVPYMSHDRGACEVARALGIEVLTALQDDCPARYVASSA